MNCCTNCIHNDAIKKLKVNCRLYKKEILIPVHCEDSNQQPKPTIGTL